MALQSPRERAGLTLRSGGSGRRQPPAPFDWSVQSELWLTQAHRASAAFYLVRYGDFSSAACGDGSSAAPAAQGEALLPSAALGVSHDAGSVAGEVFSLISEEHTQQGNTSTQLNPSSTSFINS